MQDRFKFRCFDKKNKCMHYPTRHSNFSIVNGVIVKFESYLTGNGVYRGKRVAYEFDDAILMQCTGLKDKNGRLIYEGDILGGIYENLYIHWCDKCKQFQLKAQVFGCVACEGDIYWYEVVEDNNKLEVIGNIYENPELLEGD